VKILAVDVHYSVNRASIAGIMFHSWEAPKPVKIYYGNLTNVKDYESRKFYKRELPCILKLIKANNLKPDIILIDGYVYLDGFLKPGLGKYLYDSLKQATSIIGIAKNPLKSIGSEYQIYRGSSRKPLYITVVGISLDQAKENILKMYGKYRIPYLLKQVDQLCKSK